MSWNISVIIPLSIGLALFGTLYAIFVYRLGDSHQGHTSLLVAGGVGFTTLALFPVIGWAAVATVLVAFVLTGVPMIVGEAIKDRRDQEANEKAKRDMLSKFLTRGLSEVEDETEAPR